MEEKAILENFIRIMEKLLNFKNVFEDSIIFKHQLIYPEAYISICAFNKFIYNIV